MLCEYGCKKDGNFKLKNGKFCCSKHYNSCESNRKKNSDGIKKAYKNGKKSLVFTDEHRKKSTQSYIKNLQKLPFEKRGSKLKRDLIFAEQNGKCDICLMGDVWQGMKINFDLDHINGNNQDNKRENLRLICPNCHSQTSTYKGRNINTGFKKVSDSDLLYAVKTMPSIHAALKSLGLAAKGGNYERVYKLLDLDKSQ